MKIRDLKEDLLKQWKVMLMEKYCGKSVLNYYQHFECDEVLSILDEEQRSYWFNIFIDSNSFNPDVMEDSIQKISIQPKNSIFINESEPMIENKLWTSTYNNPCWVEAKLSDSDEQEWRKVLFIADNGSDGLRYLCAMSLDDLRSHNFNVYKFSEIRPHEEKINIELTKEEAKQVMEFLKTIK
jgi:hypothetical protein